MQQSMKFLIPKEHAYKDEKAPLSDQSAGLSSTLPLLSTLESPMKSTKAGAITSTLSPHAEPFFSRRFCSSAVEDSSFVSSPVDTYYSSPFQPQVSYAILENYYESPYIPYHFSGEWAPTPVSTSPSPSYPSPNAKLALSPCLTLKKLEFACDPTSKLSSDDPSLIDSPCYKGRNWSQTTPHHIGETSAPLLVTVEKLREEHNLSIVETPIARLMVSDEKEKGLSVPVPAVPLDSGLEIGSYGGNSIKKKLDPGMQAGSSREEMLLQKIVDLSDMLLQIPSNAADLAQGNYKKVKMIIEDLEKLMEKSKKDNLSKHTRAYRLDKEKGKEHTYSASCAQKRYFEDNEENIEATVYKNMWINAELEKCELKYKLLHARTVVDAGTNK